MCLSVLQHNSSTEVDVAEREDMCEGNRAGAEAIGSSFNRLQPRRNCLSAEGRRCRPTVLPCVQLSFLADSTEVKLRTGWFIAIKHEFEWPRAVGDAMRRHTDDRQW